jgi:HK97 family phage major capsid protein
MPQGIVTRLAQTSKPSNYSSNERTWDDLHTSNLKAITNKTGVELFKEIATISGATRNDYASGAKFWAMNEATKLKLTVEAMSLNSAGAIVTGMQSTMPVIGGTIETLNFIPDNQIIGGYGELYVLAERAGVKLATSEHCLFIEDQTVFKGTARYDGKPVIAEGFVGIGIAGTAPDADDVTFTSDTANP